MNGEFDVASTNRAYQFSLIGEALHLIQDSFAPAHVEREQRTGDILNIRVYDPKPPTCSPALANGRPH